MTGTILETLVEACQRLHREFELEKRCPRAVIYLQREALDDIYHGMAIVHLHAMTWYNVCIAQS